MTSLPRETDVIISGGGPVGLTLANLLGQAQIGVIVPVSYTHLTLPTKA